MPRERRTPLFAVAMSPARAADAIGIRADEIYEAINAGLVPVYQKGIRRRVLVADLSAWVRTWPRARIGEVRKRRSKSHD